MNSPKYKELKDKVVAITGGGGILGSTLGAAFASQGAKVCILDLNIGSAQTVSEKINNDGGSAMAFKVDVLDRESLEEAKKEITRIFGPCDILVNGAGGNHPLGTTSGSYLLKEDLLQTTKDFKTFFDLDMEGIQFVFNLNFIGTLLPTQIFSREMVGRTGCSVLNISSMNAFTPLTKIPAYSGAKAAVSNFTQWLAIHFSKVGIRVNALAPGFFLTEQNRNLLTKPEGGLTSRGAKIIDQTPMGRFGEPEDLVGTTLWLISEQSKFITGIVVPIDGGFSAFSGV
ncbi:SDR family oxidoreductase [Flagellimonas taeanensis]|uniref:SDR family oxidoreductase n=1 Tax=Flavobacteriaceae TaxID=49546 RepID=UPI000E688D1A|nr:MULTISPECIES: SDR family oxidoreductase [Allomuricauda]MDC6385393.1 SDR family oxidoreductase [Muricauda sp. SK9]RIV53091.1 SDR family oxidoreductase [Allomuricauda taeanensis]